MQETDPKIHRDDEQVRDRTIKLFTYLRELSELQSKTVRTIDQYEKALWFKEIPREPGCHCIAWRPIEDEEQSDVWVEIKKPRLKPPPKVADALKPWLNPQEIVDSSREYPVLRDQIILSVPDEADETDTGEQQTIVRQLAECPGIKPLWETYVQEQWWSWAEEDRRLQAVQKVYSDLFSIYQKQQRLGETYEVVLGLGYLTWRKPGGHEVKRHVITAQTSLTFDAERAVIRVGPAGEGAKPTLEQDMLEPQERPDPARQNAIERQVEEIGDTIWDGLRIQAALKGWIHALSPRGDFDESLIPQTVVGNEPKIHLAPALILRKRTERNIIRVFRWIIERLRAGDSVPTGVRRLVTIMGDPPPPMDDLPPPSDRDKKQDRRPVEEIYFPLPSNDEQREIASRLSSRQGVLVQGPPGTGKSHTIANLVCHLLAMGQRVLVTSHTARALKVLKGKFPKEVADLCVVLLGNDLDAMQALQDSVQGITARYNNWNPKRNERLITELESKLDQARRAEATTLNELRGIREAETYRHSLRFGTYEGTAQAIANLLHTEESRFSWLTVRPEEEDESPLSDIEAVELLRLLREIDRGLEEELTKRAVHTDTLLNPVDFVTLVQSENDLRIKYEEAAHHRRHPAYATLASMQREKRKELAGRLSGLRTAYKVVVQHIQSWTEEAATQILADRDRAWRDLLTITRQHLETIGDRSRRASDMQVSGLGERDRSIVKAHALAILQHLEAGGKLGIGPFRPKVVKETLYLVKEVRVDGQLCNKPQPLRELIERIEIAELLNTIRREWSRHIDTPSGTFTAQVAEYEDLCEPLEQALDLHSQLGTIKQMIAAIPGFLEPVWHDPEELKALQEAAESVTLQEALTEVRSKFNHFEHHLRTILTGPNAHPILGRALEAIQVRDERRYGEAHQTLLDLHKSRKDLEHRHNLLLILDVAAHELASELTSSYGDQIWDQRMAEFTAAWNWGRADRWLRRLKDPHAQKRLSNQLDRDRSRIREVTRKLAEAKAWGYCFERLKDREHEHLMAWTKAMRRIGKGTGRYAAMHRKAARGHMEECRSAIPAWIMPVYRVAETIDPRTEKFDVVIVDEASQSGPEALFLHFLAEKAVVVGDDKQISPEFVGITRQDVELLRQRHILEIPHSDALGVDNSFFDQAEIRYGGRIRLREHFRCMPEIIQFSNNLCYSSEPLVPLRQYGAARLAPVIAVRHVPDGYQKGKSPKVVNPSEAHAIVDQITKCCDDPAYLEKSMGVISLLGDDQARLIEKLLLEKIGPEEMEKRSLICGDAYDFQGDERDVMFLSLVAAPEEGRRIGTLASQRDERRFNVAASRARDQMYLFHTATVNDLSPRCLRYRLLKYCQNPQVEPSTLGGLDIETIRAIARTSDRDRDDPPSPFESWFEVDVFLKISNRGHRVIPQFEIAGYRIDLVVEGMQGRLAVECDGDAWHGPDRYAEDAARERTLVRCGMIFWRVGGSTFYRDPDAAMEGLWDTLDRCRIYPTSRSYRLPQEPPAAEDGQLPAEEFSPTAQVRDHEEHPIHYYPHEKTDVIDEKKAAGTIETRPKERERSDVQLTNLTPYRRWTPRRFPDPRAAAQFQVAQGLTEIIAAEGPMVCHRAYRIYLKAAGIQKVELEGIKFEVFQALHGAIRLAKNLEWIEERNEFGTFDQINQIIRKAGTPAVVLRTLGNRTFQDIPPAEIGEMMKCLRTLEPNLEDEALLQSVLKHYEIENMTPGVRARLSQIKAQYVDG